jgi:hypothetical protein
MLALLDQWWVRLFEDGRGPRLRLRPSVICDSGAGCAVGVVIPQRQLRHDRNLAREQVTEARDLATKAMAEARDLDRTSVKSMRRTSFG